MQDIIDRIQGTKLFNDSTYAYNLCITANTIGLHTNEESAEFGADIQVSNGTTIGDVPVVSVLVLGNQHPQGVVREILRIRKWDEALLREYSMFTIGDICLVTADKYFMAINGDLITGNRVDVYNPKRGNL